MSFDWTEFLVFAEALQKALQANPDSLGSSEAAFRSAASRAYYAAFHRALDFAVGEGYVPLHSGDDHRRVPQHFRHHEPSNKTRRKIAQQLDRLLKHRHRADYDDDLGQTRPSTLAALAIGSARTAVENLDSLIDS